MEIAAWKRTLSVTLTVEGEAFLQRIFYHKVLLLHILLAPTPKKTCFSPDLIQFNIVTYILYILNNWLSGTYLLLSTKALRKITVHQSS